jgi:hypothetical protein
LSQEAADDVIAIALLADVIELGQRLGERVFEFQNGVFRKTVALLLKPPFVLQELLPIEIGTSDGKPFWRRPAQAQHTRVAVCDSRHIAAKRTKTSLPTTQIMCQ